MKNPSNEIMKDKDVGFLFWITIEDYLLQKNEAHRKNMKRKTNAK